MDPVDSRREETPIPHGDPTRDRRPLDLQRNAAATAAAALRTGALLPLASRFHVVEDGGIPFVVRVLESLRGKDRSDAAQRRHGGNPFLPYDADLFVADVPPAHVCLLNKWSVVEGHLLIVTRDFAEQRGSLTADDFAAVWAALADLDGLAFYNAAPEAGATQRHRHFQLVPPPLGTGPARTPVDPLFAHALPAEGIGRIPGFAFAHGALRLDDLAGAAPEDAGPALRDRWKALVRAAGARPTAPYNLLLTRDWMFAAGRSRGHLERIPVNALGFAGGLLARSDAQLERVRALGPLRLLAAVSLPDAAGG